MKHLVRTAVKAALFFLAMTVLTGVIYTAVCVGIGQTFFPFQANGSIVEDNDGNRYCLALGQSFTCEGHMWGRATTIDTETFSDEAGSPLAWAEPSNLSPASDAYAVLVAERVRVIREAHPDKAGLPIPSDLVTSSGSGLDPDISPAAAEYQVGRLSKQTGKSADDIRSIIRACTTGPAFGLFGEERVNVLKVNLMLDGVLS